MKVQAGKKTGKQTSERTSIGQTSAPARTKNGLNGSSIHARFRKKGFYSAYTPSAALFLASEESSFINGAALYVDNGWFIKG
jgi:NAD(P)-dependent dehydrogenase (short-subunit alcohol dehydrogenase family)